MLYKNVASQKIAVFAYTASTGAAKTGDAAQITAYISKDFAAGAATNDVNPTEMDATNMPGWYVFDLTQAETNAEVIVLAPKSSTSGVVLDQAQVFTQDAAISSRASQTSVDDVPTVVEFEARTLVAADYVVVSDLPSVPTASDNATAAAAAILATPANKLATDATGAASANVTMQGGVAVAAADANGNIPVNIKTIKGSLAAVDGLAGLSEWYDAESYVAVLGQDIRDAMKLAPSAGAPAAGSVDAKLDDILTTIGSEIVEGTYTRDDILRIIAAALAGETSGSGTPTVTITGLDGATTRITATVDGNGNRTGMTLDGAA